MVRKCTKKKWLYTTFFFLWKCFQWGVFWALWLWDQDSEGGRRGPTQRQNGCCTGVLTPRKRPLMLPKHDWQEGVTSQKTFTHTNCPPSEHPFHITQSNAGLHSGSAGFHFHVAPKAKWTFSQRLQTNPILTSSEVETSGLLPRAACCPVYKTGHKRTLANDNTPWNIKVASSFTLLCS